jgi:hypothetical protein
LNTNQKLSIDVVSADGKPLEPKQQATKFINQCGVIVRDMILITVQEWNEPKKARLGATFVNKRSKKDLWRKLMANFILPSEYSKKDDDGDEILSGHERRRRVKQYALKKMAEAFRGFKKMLYAKKKTLVFEGAYEKLRQQWPEFVAFKASERAKEMSEKNRANAEKKEHHHILGPGGYKSAVPKWEAMENELRNRRITPGTEGWPERAKHWWYGHGGSLDPATGSVFIGNRLLLPQQNLLRQ